MTDLPTGWEWSTVRELATLINGDRGKHYPSKSDLLDEGLPFVNAGHLQHGRLDHSEMNYISQERFDLLGGTAFEGGDILYCLRGSLGKMAVVRDGETGKVASSLVVVRPSPQMSSEFLFHWLSSPEGTAEIARYDNGSAQPNLAARSLAAFRLPVPCIEEQERIVTAIEEAFSKLDAGESGLRTVRQLLKRMRDAILAAAVTGRLVPQDPTDTPATQLLADLGVDPIEQNDLPDPPDGWAWVSLGQGVGNSFITDGPFGSNLKSEHYRESGPRVIRLQNIGDRVFRDEQAHISQEHFEQLRKHEVVAGDVLVASLGEVLPRACVAPPWLGPAIVKADCIRVRPGRAFSGSFLEIALNSSPVRTAVSGSIKGVGRPRLNLGDLRALVLPVPPENEQARIVTEVGRQMSFVDACERAVDGGLERSAALRRSVLEAAFEGRLVPQDPTDEPASVLLSRIRAERPAAPNTKTRRTKVES